MSAFLQYRVKMVQLRLRYLRMNVTRALIKEGGGAGGIHLFMFYLTNYSACP